MQPYHYSSRHFHIKQCFINVYKNINKVTSVFKVVTANFKPLVSNVPAFLTQALLLQLLTHHTLFLALHC